MSGKGRQVRPKATGPDSPLMDPTPRPVEVSPGPVAAAPTSARRRVLSQFSVWAPDDNRGDPTPSPSRDRSVSPERAADLSSMPYREYLQSPEWAARRLGKILAADRRCQVCNSKGPLEVHHRTYERRGAERWGDLTVLCEVCHGLFTAHGRLVEPA